jgi:hypothetical protein
LKNKWKKERTSRKSLVRIVSRVSTKPKDVVAADVTATDSAMTADPESSAIADLVSSADQSRLKPRKVSQDRINPTAANNLNVRNHRKVNARSKGSVRHRENVHHAKTARHADQGHRASPKLPVKLQARVGNNNAIRNNASAAMIAVVEEDHAITATVHHAKTTRILHLPNHDNVESTGHIRTGTAAVQL